MESESIGKKIVITTLIISIFGLIMVFDASMGLIAQKYHYITLQAIWMILGSIIAFIAYKFDYRELKKYALVFLIFVLISLIVVIVFSSKINGSQRWIKIGFVSLQPSEFAKLFFIIYISAWLTKFYEKKLGEIITFSDNLKHFLIPYFLITSLVAGLIIIEKDMGTTIVILSIALFILIIADNKKYIFPNLGIVTLIYSFLGVILIAIEPYRIQRILTFLHLSKATNTVLSSGYQVHQILIAIGSGGITGVGFTQSIQKNQYLVGTTAITDSIFAVIAEELGLIGAIILIAMLLYLIYLILLVSIKSTDTFGKFIAAGIAAWIGIQAFINIAANIGVIPLTGVPLPLISYGGSSVITILAGIGIVLSINRINNTHEKQ